MSTVSRAASMSKQGYNIAILSKWCREGIKPPPPPTRTHISLRRACWR